MRLLLVVPISTGLADPFAYPPMGPLMIAAAAREAGHDPDILFAHWEPGMGAARYGRTSDLSTYLPADQIPFRSFDVIGLNVFAEATYDAAAAAIRDFPQDRWIIGGGAFVTSASDEALQMGMDVAVIDEGEGQIVELLEVFRDFDKILDVQNGYRTNFYHERLSKIGGIAYYDETTKHRMTPHRSYLRELDELPYPAWDLIDRDIAAKETHVHLAPNSVSATVFVTRGCPWNCTFCNREIGGRVYRTNSPDYILQHLNFLRDNYGVTHVRFPDDMFTTNKKWVLEVSVRLGAEGFTWVALSRTDTLDDEMIGGMVDGGCKGLFFGIESGSPKMLKLMRKKTTPDINAAAMDRCRRFGIISSGYFIFGFPGEDAATVHETIDWLKHARPDRAHYSTFLPIHGTDPHRHPEQFGIRIKPGYRNWMYYIDDLDRTDFPVDYLPPNPSNDEMKALRREFETAFERLNYKRWKHQSSVAEPTR